MIPASLKQALRSYKAGELDEEQLLGLLLDLPYQDLGFAKVDHHRAIRHGFPEVILGLGKTDDDVISIARASLEKNPNLLITRTSSEVLEALREHFPMAHFEPRSRSLCVIRQPSDVGRGIIAILAAGTADIPVAEEARVTAEAMGNRVSSHYDVGVAGIHRVLEKRDRLRECSVAITVAGMEGALPSVVGGLVDIPIVAVPTSVGYGASFNGLAALLGMLNSCASNVSVVNIDNGFGAGYCAAMINRRRENR